MTNSPLDSYVAGALLLVVGPLWVLALLQMWRNDERWREPPAAWIGGRAEWFGTVRASLSAFLLFVSIALLVPAGAVLPSGSRSHTAAVVVLTMVSLLALGLVVTTALLNWPKELVPPPRRGDLARRKARRPSVVVGSKQWQAGAPPEKPEHHRGEREQSQDEPPSLDGEDDDDEHGDDRRGEAGPVHVPESNPQSSGRRGRS